MKAYKHILAILGICPLLPMSSKGQIAYNYRFQNNDVGFNSIISVSKCIKKVSHEVGIRVHHNHYQVPPLIYGYKKQFHAQTLPEFFGLSYTTTSFSYHRGGLRLGWYIDNQLSRIRLKYNERLIESYITGNDTIFSVGPISTTYRYPNKPLYNVEINSGVALSYQLNKQLSLVQRVGVGAAFFFGHHINYLKPSRPLEVGFEAWEFSLMWSIGLSIVPK